MENQKESYEVIEQRLSLAKLTIELGQVTREKWRQMELMKSILLREEKLLKEIAEASIGFEEFVATR